MCIQQSAATYGDSIDRAIARLQRGRFTLLIVRPCLLAMLVGGSIAWRERPTIAATGANVTVNGGAPLATISSTAFGLNSAVWDANLLDGGVPGLIQNALTLAAHLSMK
jgi:hypothetical protein